MGRLLILLAIAIVAIWLIRRAVVRWGRRDAPAAPPKAGELVTCARCGVNLPAPEARLQDGRTYCSEEHARLGPGDGK
jgi:uncharacterized protein